MVPCMGWCDRGEGASAWNKPYSMLKLLLLCNKGTLVTILTNSPESQHADTFR